MIVSKERTLGPRVQQSLDELLKRFGRRRTDVLALRAVRRDRLRDGDVACLPDTAHIRGSDWRIDPIPEALLDRRVELLGGCMRSDLVHGLNSGACSYIADLWNLTTNEPWSIVRAHRALERAVRLELAHLDPTEGRVHADPATRTRLVVAPRPLRVLESSVLLGDEPAPAAFFDLSMIAVHDLHALVHRQGGLYLVLRDVQGHLEARLWSDLLDALEQDAGLPRGTIRVTVMLDSIAGALEADEIIFELMHHMAGMCLDPQGYVADHIALFHDNDAAVFPDREAISMEAPFLRALSQHTIGLCHRRGCQAIGPASFVLPSRDPLRVKPEYMEMLADKEREIKAGCVGTIVTHAASVDAVLTELEKSPLRSHPPSAVQPVPPLALIEWPSGPISVESLVSTIRTCLRVLVERQQGKACTIQGGRTHDRSSLRLALRLLWHWNHGRHGAITATNLEIGEALLRYLVKKEAEKMFGDADHRTRALARQVEQLVLDLVLAPSVPLEPHI